MAATKKASKNIVGRPPRRRKLTKKQEKTVTKTIAKKKSGIPNSFRLTIEAVKVIFHNRHLMVGLFVIFLVLDGIFATGFSTLWTTIGSLRDSAAGSTHVKAGLDSYGLLLGGSGGTSSASSVLESVLLVLQSLVIIYVLRSIFINKKPTIRQSYYQSMAPLVPFLIILAFIVLQLLPVSLGVAFLSIFINGSVLSGATATVILSLAFIGLSIWSMYMVSSSIFALYIVTLPDMTPRRALRSAKELVAFRRWKLMRRIIFIPFVVLLALAVVVIPIAIVSTAASAVVFYILAAASLFFVHTYLYSLYRSLLA